MPVKLLQRLPRQPETRDVFQRPEERTVERWVRDSRGAWIYCRYVRGPSERCA